jgi:hypothetical protein
LIPSAGAALAALVSISVAPDDVSAESSSIVVRSCETALGEGKCRLEGQPPSVAEWHATVTASDPTLSSVRIEVRKESSDAAPETREITFSQEDSTRERWASVGVVIAALVVAGSRAPESPAPAPPAPPPPPAKVPPKPQPLPPPPSRMFRFDLRALGARRTTEGFPELGIELGASVLPIGAPVFAGVSIAGSHRFGAAVGATWFSGSVGGGVRIGSSVAPVACEFRGALVGEYWRFEASEPGRAEHSGKARIGGLVGVDALFAVGSKWILSLGVEGLAVGPRLRVDVGGRLVETIPSYGVLVAAGLRFLP